MSSSFMINALDSIMKAEQKLTAKHAEISKRREYLETLKNTSTVKQKEESKIEVLDSKIQQKTAALDKTIAYYQNEIEKSQRKMEETIRAAEIKFEEAKRKAEEHFINYRNYCNAAILTENNKKDTITGALERKKEQVERSMEKPDEEDPTLIRLTIELKQLEEERKVCEEKYLQATKEHQENLRKLQFEEVMKQKEKDAYELMRAKEEYNHKQRIEQEREAQRKEERRQQFQREEEEKKAEEEQKKSIKSERKVKYNRWLKEGLPHLSPDLIIVSKTLQAEADELYEGLLECKNLEEYEDYLESHQGNVELFLSFEEKQVCKLTNPEKHVWENDYIDYFNKLKAIKMKDKLKRRDFILRFKPAEEEPEQGF